MARPTYVFENGKAYAFVNGQVVASAETLEDLQKLAFGDPAGDEYADAMPNMDPESFGVPQQMHDDPQSPYFDPPCPNCGRREGAYEGGHCLNCGYQDPQGGAMPTERGPYDDGSIEPGSGAHWSDPEPRNYMGAVIQTPGGLKGKILGSTKDLWDREQVTVRLENGHIAHLTVGDFQHVASEQRELPSQVEALRTRLAASTPVTKDALKARISELKTIKAEAGAAVASSDEVTATALDSLVVEADYELRQAVEVLAGLEAAEYESFIPDAPFQSHVVEQASMGATANWLDAVHADMVAEAETTDFQKLIDEGPEAFVAGLDAAPLADQGATRQMAASFISSKTAGIPDRELVAKYEQMFLDRVEGLRRSELRSRTERVRREASAQVDEFASYPDDVLFG